MERARARQLFGLAGVADGRVYLFSEEGRTTVIQDGREFKVLAENQLGDGFMASPAISGGSLFLRSRTHLYRIDQPAPHGKGPRDRSRATEK